MRKSVKARPLAVSLLSGGMDSCVTAAIALKTHDVAALHASYGQRTEAREKRAFMEITKRLGVKKTLVLDLGFMKEIGGSSLTDRAIPVPEGIAPKGIPSTYVPFRNGVLLAVATAWAESLGAEAIFIGAVAPDGLEGYPDTTLKFFEAFERAANIGTRPDTNIQIIAPIVGMNKSEVLRVGLELKAPFDLTWSCYQREDFACGRCLSCIGRMKAFRKIGVADSIPYESSTEKYA